MRYYCWGYRVVNVYMGVNSCYARREGVFVARVKHPGIDTVAEAVGILYLIVRDRRRGWTYDQDNHCRKVRMTNRLFVERANYVRVLARRHGAGPHTLAVIDRLVEYVLSTGKLPRTVTYRRKRYSVDALVEAVLVRT